MKKVLLSFLLLQCVVLCSMAQPLGEVFLRAEDALGKSDLVLFQERNGCYVFNSMSGGFCIVRDGGIVALSPKGTADEDLIGKLSLNEMPTALLGGKKFEAAVEPFMDGIEFDQSSPFNDALPKLAGKNCVTGCVATATAQIMKYYEYPSATATEIPSYSTTTYGVAMDAIPENTAIDWSLIKGSYGNTASDAEKAAVADLMKIVCTGVQADLRPNESTSYQYLAYKALRNHFGFDKDLLSIVERSAYTISQFEGIVYAELAQGRPVLITGESAQGGHAFVCDGYSEGLFHINWGWSGRYDGFYDMSVLAPDAKGQIGASSSQDGYNQNCFAIIGLMPDNGTADTPIEMERHNLSVNKFRETSLYPRSSSGIVRGNISFTFHHRNGESFPSYYSLGIVNASGEIELIGNAELFSPAKFGDGLNTSFPFAHNFADNATYRIYAVESLDGVNWQLMGNSLHCYLDLKIESNAVSPLFYSEPELTAKLSFSMQGSDKYVTARFRNDTDEEYYSFVYGMLNDDTGYFVKSGLTVPAHGAAKLTFKYSDYTLDDENLVRFHYPNGELIASAMEDFNSSVDDEEEDDDDDTDDELPDDPADDKPSSIAGVDMPIAVRPVAGGVEVSAQAPATVSIYTVSGALCKKIAMTAGETKRIRLRKGVYAAGRCKFTVE